MNDNQRPAVKMPKRIAYRMNKPKSGAGTCSLNTRYEKLRVQSENSVILEKSRIIIYVFKL